MKTQRIKRLAASLLVLCLIVGLLPIMAFAEEPMSGSCGAEGNENSVTWRLEQNNPGDGNPTYTLTISGEGAMRDFGNESNTPWYGKGAIQTLVIENGVTSVGSATARWQVALEKVVLADSVIKIGGSAFQKCTSLAEMNFPSGLQEIGTFAFSGTSLERADLSACTDLNSWERAFQQSNVKEVMLPDNLEAIPAHAFDGSKLLNITLPEELQSIEESAFLSTALTEISIPDSVTSIGKLAFAYTKLQSVIIPSSVTAIADQTFMNTNMNAIVLPGNLTTIGNNCFNVSNATIFIVNIENYADCPVKQIVDSTWSWCPIAVTNGGTFTDDAVFEAGKLATPIKTGYTFGGWYDNEECTGEEVTIPEAGKTYYAKWEVCTHNWEEATCTEPKTCSVCGATEGAALGHSFTNYIYNNDATYDADGTKTAKCDHGCGEIKTVTAGGTKLTRPSSGYLPILRPPVMLVMPGLPFTDVSESAWYYDAVEYVYEEGLMNGVGGNKFNPMGDTTRGMIVTILYRQSGSPRVRSDKASWWSDARAWAMEEGVSDGTDMDGKITREQLAAMLYRYAQCVGLDMSTSTNLSRFSDAKNVSGWALDAMQWAVGESIVNGRPDGTLDPKGLATRAEVAAMFMRYCGLAQK